MSEMTESELTSVDRLHQVQAEIARAATDCGRKPSAVALVAVSKTFDGDHIWPVIEAGQRVFGENRVQEAKAKWPDLRARAAHLAGAPIELHLIGPLQSNKAREALELFDVIETVDRPKIAEALAAEIQRQGKHPHLYVQVNTGAEPQKAGILPQEADAFLATCRALGLTIDGLMCIPPVEQLASPHFALLAQIAARNGIAQLSMGMSADYPLAIQTGATHVRVGSAIFGHRDHG